MKLNHLEFVLFRKRSCFVVPRIVASCHIPTADYVPRDPVAFSNMSEISDIAITGSFIVVGCLYCRRILAENLEYARPHLLQPRSLLAGQIASVLVTVIVLATAWQGNA